MSMKKLQVSEGVETFEGIHTKFQLTHHQSQKEKYEQDLKKEIKKLQRLRDQIKTWQTMNEIKDKTSLVDNRKLIESEMERFKTVEREMKTKAFSKEGLLQREKMDPKEKEKADTVDWISNTVDELSRQIEMAEAQVETMQGTKRGKKDQSKAEMIESLEHYMERDRWHINRLELVLRLLENDQLAVEKIMDIKEDVQYYLECNQEPDFEEDEYIYDDLNLEEEEELYNIGTEDHATPSIEQDTKPVIEEPTVKPLDIEPPKVKQPELVPPKSTVDVSTKATEKEFSSTQVTSAWTEPIKISEPKPAQALAPGAQQTKNHCTNPTLPSSLADLGPSFEAIKKKVTNPHYANHLLESSLQYVPDLIDSERPKQYQAQSPHRTPSYYPQQPLAIFENPTLYDKFDTDALFFIFYYQQGTYQQYLAARELKRQSWRFHKKYLTWFQRHEEPRMITNDYEQGTYIYFDYENAWCQRKKTEFRFEYCYLEDAQ
ncbi:hypothetical protein G6F56_001999 [Rhizopus delemar]|nr:hypothetical protein G6F56_001999 [Rhizopus delemar]